MAQSVRSTYIVECRASMFGITIVSTWDPLGSGSRILVDGCKDFATGSMRMYLVHGWDRIKNFNVYSLLALRTHKHFKCYPTMTKV